MQFYGLERNDTIHIEQIYSMHYFEFSRAYAFPGEKHNFWEAVYVDRGKITVTAEEETYELGAGDLFFHKPNQWHTIRSRGGTAPVAVVFSFSCHSPAMIYFEDLLTTAAPGQKELIARIVSESRRVFRDPLDELFLTRLSVNPSAPPGSEQLIWLYMTEFLLSVFQEQSKVPTLADTQMTHSSILDHVILYMKAHLNDRLTLQELAKRFHISVSSMKLLFKKETGMGAIDYFIHLKLEYARQLLREKKYNITQISFLLGYDSVASFSAQFKQKTGMSPTEYSKSIQAMDELTKRPR